MRGGVEWGGGGQALSATWNWFRILSAKPVEVFSLVIPVLCALGEGTPGKQKEGTPLGRAFRRKARGP